jgi:hypothetical protein
MRLGFEVALEGRSKIVVPLAQNRRRLQENRREVKEIREAIADTARR